MSGTILMSQVSIKTCGLTSTSAVHAAIAAGADYVGFVTFPASPRHIEPSRARELKALLPASISTVSVLVDPDDALLQQVQIVLQPEYIQLHGNETTERIEQIRRRFPALKIIKAIRVSTTTDIESASIFFPYADVLLFDAKAPTDSKIPGGNGLAFDWALLKDRRFPLPWFLSGGLTPENVADAIRQTGAQMIDVSSGIESAPGVKDPLLIQRFITNAKAY